MSRFARNSLERIDAVRELKRYGTTVLFENDGIDSNTLNHELVLYITLSFDGNQFVEFLITFSVGVASGVVGNYIYNAIHTATKKLEINGRRTRLTEESISQAIETIKQMLEEKDQGDKSPRE